MKQDVVKRANEPRVDAEEVAIHVGAIIDAVRVWNNSKNVSVATFCRQWRLGIGGGGKRPTNGRAGAVHE